MKTLLLFHFMLLAALTASAQEQTQKIIFDVTSTDIKVHTSVMLIMKVMAANHPNATLEVMVYGEALPMVMKGHSVVAKEIGLYANNDKVKFTACELSMKLLFNIDETQLLEGVGTVGNAIPDIVTKQSRGWGYIKTAL